MHNIIHTYLGKGIFMHAVNSSRNLSQWRAHCTVALVLSSRSHHPIITPAYACTAGLTRPASSRPAVAAPAGSSLHWPQPAPGVGPPSRREQIPLAGAWSGTAATALSAFDDKDDCGPIRVSSGLSLKCYFCLPRRRHSVWTDGHNVESK